MRGLVRLTGILLGGLLVAVVAAWWVARPTPPDAFYAHAGAIPDPGTLIRQAPMTTGLPAGTVGYRLLYATTRQDGRAAVASAVLLRPDHDDAAPLIAWAHGTIGVRPGCAPSAMANPFPNIPGFPALFGQGWAYLAPDYPGLGTMGGHAYLVGDDAARAVLDAISAAHQVQDAPLAPETVIWGHSQGGHAALWAARRAGQVAPAPGVSIRGVAAVAPASDLPALAQTAADSLFGRIVLAYLAEGYDIAYPDAGVAAHFDTAYRGLLADIAGRCIEMPDALLSLAEAALIPAGAVIARPLTEAPLAGLLAANVPQGPFAMPVLIAQGAADDLVLPDVQRAYVRGLCAQGAKVDYRSYAGRDHVSVVAPDSPLTADLLGWTADRFANSPAAAACPGP